jgi:hypothetical protein
MGHFPLKLLPGRSHEIALNPALEIALRSPPETAVLSDLRATCASHPDLEDGAMETVLQSADAWRRDSTVS